MENIQHEYFIWEEKNSTDLNQNLLKNEKSVKESSIIETKNDLTQKDWKDITNPKLRKKMQKKTWREANKDKAKAYKKNWCEVNKEKLKVQKKNWDIINRDKIKDYKKTNRVKRNSYENNKKKTDIQYKLKSSLRTRLYQSINGNFKAGSAVRDLGCTVEQLKQYLESKFLPGMSWDNWTHDGWHIDHIKPLDSFDLIDRNQLLEACHYTNLQPLWAKDNLVKSNKLK
jgi:hypothetical protein